ncbi:hypothetical protein AAFN86_19600 [Roseomonas sp. CAU 1739]|uniref:hypothetical protein n=1 Tax=Roseomonas sp. CAU 1739 TaxID=3140364 RepID=UPI00325AE0ED
MYRKSPRLTRPQPDIERLRIEAVTAPRDYPSRLLTLQHLVGPGHAIEQAAAGMMRRLGRGDRPLRQAARLLACVGFTADGRLHGEPHLRRLMAQWLSYQTDNPLA